MNAIAPRMRLDVVGREIARAALYLLTARAGKREPPARQNKRRQPQKRAPQAMAPTLERFRHGQIIEPYDGAVAEAGVLGHRVVDACLLDALRERGVLGGGAADGGENGNGNGGEAALLRHSAGLWLRGLFHDCGLMRSVTMRLQRLPGDGDAQRSTTFERHHRAACKLALYQAAMTAMERRVFHGRGAVAMGPKRRRRATQAVREIACWDRLPAGFGVAEIRAAFDRLARVMDAVGVGSEGGDVG